MSSRNSSRGPQNQRRSLASSSGTKKVTKITKKSRPKDANYQQKLIDNGIYPCRYKPNGNIPPLPPKWEEINRRLTRHRPSLSLSRFSSNDDYQKSLDAEAEAFNEDEVKDFVIPAMLSAMGSLPSGAKKNILFTNIDGPTRWQLAFRKPSRSKSTQRCAQSSVTTSYLPTMHIFPPCQTSYLR